MLTASWSSRNTWRRTGVTRRCTSTRKPSARRDGTRSSRRRTTTATTTTPEMARAPSTRSSASSTPGPPGEAATTRWRRATRSASCARSSRGGCPWRSGDDAGRSSRESRSGDATAYFASSSSPRARRYRRRRRRTIGGTRATGTRRTPWSARWPPWSTRRARRRRMTVRAQPRRITAARIRRFAGSGNKSTRISRERSRGTRSWTASGATPSAGSCARTPFTTPLWGTARA
mmetsp:Transcript_5312/g.23712  ORF Transcript_5312/g.23712 Transcript_5312/m.23712 type:complete len:232 (+) Transcript_5312:95-790(+)